MLVLLFSDFVPFTLKPFDLAAQVSPFILCLTICFSIQKENYFYLMLLYRNLLYFCSGFHRGMVQSASILAWGASGRPFESGCSDRMFKSGVGLHSFFFLLHCFFRKLIRDCILLKMKLLGDGVSVNYRHCAWLIPVASYLDMSLYPVTKAVNMADNTYLPPSVSMKTLQGIHNGVQKFIT